jgi:hypothetical protein
MTLPTHSGVKSPTKNWLAGQTAANLAEPLQPIEES